MKVSSAAVPDDFCPTQSRYRRESVCSDCRWVSPVCAYQEIQIGAMIPAFLSPTPVRLRRNERPSISSRKKNIARAILRRGLPRAPTPNIGTGSNECYVRSVRRPQDAIFTRVWEAHIPATAGCVIIPGYQWHSGWFSNIAVPLARVGVRVVGVDGAGTGRSDTMMRTKGLILHMDDHVDEIAAAIERLSDSLPRGSPIFILGESSGGTTACALALRNEVSKRVAGWILCSPAITISEEILPPRLVVSVLKAVSGKFPKLPTPGESVSGDTFDAAFGDGFSHTIAKKDPYVLYDVPVPLGTTVAILKTLDVIEEALVEENMWMRQLLVLHNSLDVRTLSSGSEKLVNRVKTERGAKLVDPGGQAHQLFQEQPIVTHGVILEIKDFVEEVRESWKNVPVTEYCDYCV